MLGGSLYTTVRYPTYNLVTCTHDGLAFNAALVLFGCLLVCRTANRTALATLPTKESAKTSLENAVEALGVLDHGNHMVERCRHYLKQLISVLDSLGMRVSPTVLNTSNSRNRICPIDRRDNAASPDNLCKLRYPAPDQYYLPTSITFGDGFRRVYVGE